MAFKEAFYQVLQERVEAEGQERFAKNAGISQSCLSKVLGDKTKSPSLNTVSHIVDYIGLEVFANSHHISELVRIDKYKNTHSKFDDIAQTVWDAIISRIKKLDEQGVKRIEIARMLNVARSVVTNWLDGRRSSPNASFPDMLFYLDALGLNVADYIPIQEEEKEEKEDFASPPEEEKTIKQNIDIAFKEPLEERVRQLEVLVIRLLAKDIG